MKASFGLDFGTTNSSLVLNQNGSVEIVDIDEYNTTGKTLRSVIFFDEEKNIYVGYEAIAQYIDKGGEGRFLQSIKSFLPSALFEYTIINGRRYKLEDIIAIILRRIKKKGEQYLGREVVDVVMGRPVIFSEDKKKDKLAENRLRKAAEMVGFKNIVFQFEPIAAAFAFERSLSKNEEKIVLIGDFGGGTSDFTIIRLSGRKLENFDRGEDVFSLGGVCVAGDIFDSELMWEKVAKFFGRDAKYKSMTGQWLDMPTSITFKLKNWHLIPQLRYRSMREYVRQLKTSINDVAAITNLENLIEDNYGFMLFQAIEKAKIELSSRDASVIAFKDRQLEIKEWVNREEFEKIIFGYISKIEACLDDMMLRIGLGPEDIDVVFTTGGTSYVPCIRNLFIRKFGEAKMKQMDAFTSVAYGLGMNASMFFD